MVAATTADVATAFVEVGAIGIALATLSAVASRFGVTAVPLYLLAGLVFGEGGIGHLGVSAEFLSLGAEIGVLLLLLTLGLEYSTEELRSGIRSGAPTGVLDAVFNFLPGFALGLVLGWSATAAVLLGGVCWVSSSGVISKVLSDLDRLGNRETPAILNLLVIEDLAMAVYLPVAAAMVASESPIRTATTVTVALATVAVVLILTNRLGPALSALLHRGSNESLLLAVFGATLVVGGVAQQLRISAAIGAFLVGLAVSGPVRERVQSLIEPLRDLFAALFFFFFASQIDPSRLADALVPACGLLVVTGFAKVVTGWHAAKRTGAAPKGRMRAGTALIARGEFSIVIASLGAGLTDGNRLSSLAAAYVLLTAVCGPLLTKHADSLVPKRLAIAR